MTGLEIIYLVAALLAVGGFVFVVRRAGARSAELGDAGQAARKRLREAREDDEEREEDEERGQEEEEPEEDEGDEEEEEDAPAAAHAAEDDERAAALRDGLARTRGGFVARLGRLLSKKKID